MSARPLLEVAVESAREARAAAEAGAERLELCADLVLGGTTPSPGALEGVLGATSLPVVVLLRPRAGDFVYDADERAVMRRDLEWIRAAGARGVALGLLDREGLLERAGLAELVELARPLEVCFHRAFDHCQESAAALDELLRLGVERVLTSGGATRALDGAAAIAALVERAGERLTVMAGGGVRADHAAELVRRTGVRELHASGQRIVPGGRGRAGLHLAGARPPSESERSQADPERLRALHAALATLA